MLQLESACLDTLQVPRVADRAEWLAAFRTDHGVAVFLAQIATEWSVGVLHCGDPGCDMHRLSSRERSTSRKKTWTLQGEMR